jgi:hypothetical protein
MGGGVEVNQPTRRMLHHHKHVEDSEASGYYQAEITGDDKPSVIPEKGRPTADRPEVHRVARPATSACTSGLCAATPAGLDRALFIECQLLAQEQVLGPDGARILFLSDSEDRQGALRNTSHPSGQVRTQAIAYCAWS